MRTLVFLLLVAACAGAPGGTSSSVAPAEPTPVEPAAPIAVFAPTTPALRLPAEVVVERAALELRVDAEQPEYSGESRFDVRLTAPTRVIWLHSEELAISSATVSGAGGEVAAEVVLRPGGFLGLVLPRVLPAGAYQVVVAFSGHLDDVRSRGLYRVKEPDGKHYTYTFFEPVDARRAFPCFDEPSFKIPWRVAITAPAGQIAVANAPLEKEEQVTGGTRHVFAETPPLPSYLVAFVVGPFEIVDAGTAGKNKVAIRFVIPTGRAGELGYAKKVTGPIVGYLEDFFQIPYPFAKLDVAVVPRFWGTMEHPGLVAMGQPLSLIKPEDESIGRMQAYANILVHELGHYWFGDLVTMAWWDETWLNEGLTTWADREVTDRVDPAWRYQRYALHRREAAMSADGPASAKAMKKPVTSATDIQDAFDGGTTYDKGDALMGMLVAWLGADVVKRGVVDYLTEWSWKNATTPDFFRALSKAAGRDLGPLLESFVLQPGVPEVSVRLSCAAGSAEVSLRQRRYRRLDAVPLAGRWNIPVCLRYPEGKGLARHCDVLADEQATWKLPLCPAWLWGNAGATGYYRVALDEAGRKAVAAHAARLEVGERYAFLTDVQAQVLAGALDVGEALALGAAFVGDKDPLVVDAALGLFSNLTPNLLADGERAAYRRAIARLLGRRAEKLGLSARAGESVETEELRGEVVSRVVWAEASPRLAKEALRLARLWLKDPGAIDEDRQGLVLWAAARAGDPRLYDQLVASLDQRQDRSQRSLIYATLGGFADPALAERTLAMLLDKERDLRESDSAMYTLLGSREHRGRAHAFVLAHWDEILPRLRDDERSGVIEWLASICDAELRASSAAALPARAAGIDGGPAALASGLERSATCLALRARNAPGVSAFLAAY